MQFNLIEERWIPIKRRDGTEERIAPWEVTPSFANNPAITINAPRPDFNGALIQFLIGLVQTTMTPGDKIEWKAKLKTPPTMEEMKAATMKVRHAFELGGNGPRFMQDFLDLNAQPKPIEQLLIDAPGDKTRRDNTDHFIKRNSINALCPSCCATALFTMQTNAPAGGSGYRTSLRGGGPLTTIIIGAEQHDTLWHTIWLNVLEADVFLNMCNAAKCSDADKFPWLAPSKKFVTEQDIHPVQYYWAMPRRIRLNLDILGKGSCDVCSRESGFLITSYMEVNKGPEYRAPMKHPLSPFNLKTQKAVLTQPGGVSYRHWLGLVVNDSEGKREPARIVQEFIGERQERDWQFRIWAFGYDMDNMKARCWYDSKIPLIYASPSTRGELENCVAGMIKAASEIAKNVRNAVKKAWFKRPEDVKGNMFFIDSTFWQSTEPVFYRTLNDLKVELEQTSGGSAARTKWHRALCREALHIFDAYAWNGPVEEVDPKRVVIARSEMQNYNNGKKIRLLLDLPVARKVSTKMRK